MSLRKLFNEPNASKSILKSSTSEHPLRFFKNFYQKEVIDECKKEFFGRNRIVNGAWIEGGEVSSFPDQGYIVYHHIVDPLYDDLGRLIAPRRETNSIVSFTDDLNKLLRAEAFCSMDLLKVWLRERQGYSPKVLFENVCSQLSKMETRIRELPEYDTLNGTLIRPVRFFAKRIAELYPMETRIMPENIRDLFEGPDEEYLQSFEFSIQLALDIVNFQDDAGDSYFFSLDYKDSSAVENVKTSLRNFIVHDWNNETCHIVFSKSIQKADYLIHLICEHRSYSHIDVQEARIISKITKRNSAKFNAAQCYANASKCRKDPDKWTTRIEKIIEKNKR